MQVYSGNGARDTVSVSGEEKVGKTAESKLSHSLQPSRGTGYPVDSKTHLLLYLAQGTGGGSQALRSGTVLVTEKLISTLLFPQSAHAS